jgi:3'(2'), 5'-bisphosphate nucleotidase
LNNLDLKSLAENLIDTFLKAGKIAKEISQKGVEIEIKADKSPVTNGDLAVDKLLQTKIKSVTPNIPIISEETVNFDIKNEDKTFWLIDPIDGTKDYIKNRDEYTLNAALIIDLKPALGMVYAPEKKKIVLFLR